MSIGTLNDVQFVAGELSMNGSPAPAVQWGGTAPMRSCRGGGQLWCHFELARNGTRNQGRPPCMAVVQVPVAPAIIRTAPVRHPRPMHSGPEMSQRRHSHVSWLWQVRTATPGDGVVLDHWPAQGAATTNRSGVAGFAQAGTEP